MTLLRLPPILLLSVTFASLSAANPKGVGLKTVNYLKLLARIQNSVAVDTHVRAFLASAGISPADDRVAGEIVAKAAALLSISAAQLDASIWLYRTRSKSVEHQVSGK